MLLLLLIEYLEKRREAVEEVKRVKDNLARLHPAAVGKVRVFLVHNYKMITFPTKKCTFSSNNHLFHHMKNYYFHAGLHFRNYLPSRSYTCIVIENGNHTISCPRNSSIAVIIVEGTHFRCNVVALEKVEVIIKS